MALENIEIVRRFIELDVEEALAYAAPDIVWNPVEEAPAEGHAAVRASLERWKGEWDDYELTPEDFADFGDRVLVTVTMRGRGRGSGIEVAGRLFDLFTLRDGKIVRLDQFSDESEALAAAGRPAAGRPEGRLELFYRTIDTLNGQDFEAFLAGMDPEIEGVPRLAAMEGAYTGFDGMRRWWDTLFGAFPDFRIEVVEVRDLGELTFAELQIEASGAGSGTPIREPMWHLAWWRDGKCTRWATFRSEDEARAAI